MNTSDIAKLFKALSEPPRIAILRILVTHPDTLSVVELIEKLREVGFELEQPTCSHHLKILHKANLVVYRRTGHWHYYSVRPDVFAAMSEVLRPFMAKVEVSV